MFELQATNVCPDANEVEEFHRLWLNLEEMANHIRGRNAKVVRNSDLTC